MEEKISMNESIEAGAPDIKYSGGDIRMGGQEDMQGKQVAAEIWSQMEPEQKVQFPSFEAFFESGIWKQILQQLQQDQSGIRSQSPEMMDSVLMLIPDDNFISFSDNIPSFAPIEGFISQRMENKFSMAENLHDGIDIVAKEGTPIKASASGLVIFSGWTYEMGNQIILYHGDGYFTHYGHNQQNLKHQLDIVKRGEVIGLVGNSGISSGPHLHFEIRDTKTRHTCNLTNCW